MIVLVGADQAVKYWAATELQPVGSIDFISVGGKKLVDLTYLENRGAIFGSMQGQRWFLIGFTSLVLIIGFVLLFKFMKRSKLLALAITLFIAGGIGNLIDRVRLSYVVDMFEFKFVDFAIFNVADICVTLAFVMLVAMVAMCFAGCNASHLCILHRPEDREGTADTARYFQ